jgi:hypothetical protein
MTGYERRRLLCSDYDLSVVRRRNTQSEVPGAVVQAWQEAANDEDADCLVLNRFPEIEAVGTRRSSCVARCCSHGLNAPQ